DERIRMMLSAVLSMYGEFEFFTAPNLSNLDEDSSNFESAFKGLMTHERMRYLNGEIVSAETALREFIG
ncbi:MAG: hypothetical protein IJ941_02690, partial [Clostridia bacterium]|nr:hypothetical protein [Clostridia bacterium]